MSGGGETYCLCGQPYAPGQFMIECDCCREWFHGGCVNVKVYQSEDIDKYHCPKCVPTYGPSVYKVPTNIHRQDRYELNAERKATQTGSGAFVTNLAARTFPTSHVVRMDPKNFTENYLKEKGFNQPVLFESSTGLDLRVPPAGTFTVRTVERHCGADREIDVIDVTRQTNFKMPLGDFVDYFTEQNRTKVLNVLSLEFSDTSMSGLVQPPAMARQLDWVRLVWPPGSTPFTPLVQKYCIMSAAASYTDFHIDFGGTTVWYHVLHGKKIFYLVPPTSNNLALYQQWSVSPKQYELFFGDLVESCSMCILKRGQTLFIPTGWIHAVLTPEDSLVFGGNFLHNHNIELQLQINEIEKQIETPSMFRFPLFETIHWYAGSHLLQQLRRINEEQQDEDFTLEENKFDAPDKKSQILLDLPPYLIRGIRVLAATLKEWNACKAYDAAKKQNIPDSINSGQLVRDLSRELRRLEKILLPSSYTNHANKKKKKKPRPQTSPQMEFKIRSPMPNTNRHFSSISKDQVVMNHVNVSTVYDQTNSRLLYNTHSNQNKKSLKLTLPKPIMHVPDSQHMFSNSSQDSEDAELTNMATIASRSGMASYSHNYDSQDSFGGENDYRIPGEHNEFERKPKKSNNSYTEIPHNERGGAVIKIKTSPPPTVEGSLRNHGPPPDYATTEHSILKSHLINNVVSARQQKQSNQWTISKSQVKNNTNDSTDEQILFTNENLTLPGTSQTSITYVNSANIPFDSSGILYGPGMYAGEGPQQINNVQPENYNPDFILDRKTAGLGLPDYSPTKSINEYLGNTTKPPFVEQTKNPQSAGNFANNSDPYAQALRTQDGVSPFSDDSSVLTGTDGYRLVQDDAKSESILQSKTHISGFVSSEQYEYMEIENRKHQDYVVIDNETEAIIKREKISNRHAYAEMHRGNLNPSDHNIIYGGNAVPHALINHVNQIPPPSYESVVAPRRTDRPTRRRIDPRSSIYDYEDQDEIDDGGLYIDETPKPPRTSKPKRKPPIDKDPNKVPTHAAHGYRQEDGTEIERDPRTLEAFAIPKNGIESLLQASAYTGAAGADNQERDAVAGMLSIGQSYGLARADASRRLPPVEAPPIRAVHKDDEYVYPSLEMSSDEDDDLTPPRRSTSRSKKRRNPFITPSGDKSDREDESWWPRGRLGRLVPRVNRPTRRGSRREAVQAALRAARLRGASEQPQLPPVESLHPSLPPHVPTVNRTPVEPTHRPPPPPSLPIREPTVIQLPKSLSSLKKPYRKKRPMKPVRPMPVQHVLPSPTHTTVKFKKGMKTAKQRLGKILKIHKMIC